MSESRKLGSLLLAQIIKDQETIHELQNSLSAAEEGLNTQRRESLIKQKEALTSIREEILSVKENLNTLEWAMRHGYLFVRNECFIFETRAESTEYDVSEPLNSFSSFLEKLKESRQKHYQKEMETKTQNVEN